MGKGAGSRRERVKDEAAAWVIRLAGTDCTAADRTAFAVWRDASPDHEVAYEREAAAWERLDRLQALRPGDNTPDPDLLAPAKDSKVDHPPLWRSWPIARRAAAVLIGVAGIGGALTYGLGLGADPAYATGIGERRVIVLTDGSRIELNTNSEIRVHFRHGRREVKLVRGEAVFDVAADSRPFVVTTSDASFTAGSAELAVRLRDNGAAVAVREGTVQAAPANPSAQEAAPVRVTAGYGGLFRPDGGRPQPISRDEMTRALAWRQDAIALDGQPLAEAVAEFNRYNIRQIVVTDPSIARFRLGGYFRTNDVNGFVRALQTTFPVRASNGPDGSVRLARAGSS